MYIDLNVLVATWQKLTAKKWYLAGIDEVLIACALKGVMRKTSALLKDRLNILFCD